MALVDGIIYMKRYLSQQRNDRIHGFSLVELLITVSIIAILVAIGIASYATINRQSRDTRRKSDLEQIRSALEMYRADNGYYPAANGSSWVVASEPTLGLTTALVPTYLPIIPTDPSSPDQDYMYQATNVASGLYYGYCISGGLEGEDPTDTCTPAPTHTYGLKNP